MSEQEHADRSQANLERLTEYVEEIRSTRDAFIELNKTGQYAELVKQYLDKNLRERGEHTEIDYDSLKCPDCGRRKEVACTCGMTFGERMRSIQIDRQSLKNYKPGRRGELG